MEEYKRSVESQHAPEALIAQTLQRIHEEERRTQQPNVTSMYGEQPNVTPMYGEQPVKKAPKKSYRKWIGAVAGMAAGLALVIGVMNSQRGLYYNCVTEGMIREAAQDGIWIQDDIDVDTYSAYLEKDMSEVPEDMTLIQQNIYVRYDDTQSEIIEDEGTFYYHMDGNQIMVKVSRSLEVAPEELLAGEASEWDDMTVYAGRNEAGTQMFAAIEQGELHYFVMGLNLSENEFEDFLKKYF